MTQEFECQLARVAGKLRSIGGQSRFSQHETALLPYWHKAESLHAAAIALWHTYADEKTAVGSEALGFDEGFSLYAALTPVFRSLAGSSIELLLKAICKGLDQPIGRHHRLVDLAGCTGIFVSDDQKIILRSMTEYIYWAGRYPTPLKPEHAIRANEVFDLQHRKSGKLADMVIKTREINLENYLQIWNLLRDSFMRVKESTFESAV